MISFKLTPTKPALTWKSFKEDWIQPHRTHTKEGEPIPRDKVKLEIYQNQRSAVRRWSRTQTNILNVLEKNIREQTKQDFLFGLIAMRARFYGWCIDNDGMEFCRLIDVIHNELLRSFVKKATEAGFKDDLPRVYKKFHIKPGNAYEEETNPFYLKNNNTQENV
jgi:hypothetical protein